MRPDSLATFQRYAPTYGVQAASEIALFELDNCRAVRDIIRAEEIACDYTEVISSSVFLDDSQAEEAKRLLGELVAEGHDILQKFKYYQGQQAEEVSGVNGAKGLTTFQAACLWYVPCSQDMQRPCLLPVTARYLAKIKLLIVPLIGLTN